MNTGENRKGAAMRQRPFVYSTPRMGSPNESGHVGVREALYRSLKID
jgi:hypothetical protein